MITGIILGSIGGLALIVVVGYIITVFNSLIQVRNYVEKAWENIDVILMQRQDELAKLIEVCTAYMTHERELLTKLTKLRVGYDDAQTSDEKLKGAMEVGLRSTGGLMSVPMNISGNTENPNLSLSGGAVFGGALGTSLLGPGIGTIVGVGTGKLFSGLASLFTHSKEESDKESQELQQIEQELARELEPPAPNPE